MNTSLSAAEKWFGELGIKTESHGHALLVSRNDMMEIAGQEDENADYAYILKELRSALNSTKLFWSGKDDDWLYLETF
jgi:hypothetical protein